MNLIHDNSQETFLLINILFDSQFLAVHEPIRISLSANTFVFTCKFFLPFQVIPLRAFWILFQLKTKKARQSCSQFHTKTSHMEMGPKKTVIPERTVLLLFFFKLRILSRNRFFSNFYYYFQKLYCFVYFTIGNALKQFSISLLVNMYSTFVNVQKVQEQLFIYFLNYIFFQFFFYILLYQFDTNARKYEGYQYNFNQKNLKKNTWFTYL